MGYNYVRGFGEAPIERVLDARSGGAFASLADFCRRTQLPQRLVEHLILAGGFDVFGKTRRARVWELGKLDYRPDTLEFVYAEDDLPLPPVSLHEVMGIEYEMLGLSLRDHVMTLYREQLKAQGILGSRDLEHCANGRIVRVAGQIVVHQAPPTAKGFHFVTGEDEDGYINWIVAPDVYARDRRVFREYPLIVVEGEVQHEGRVINVLARRAVPLAW